MDKIFRITALLSSAALLDVCSDTKSAISDESHHVGSASPSTAPPLYRSSVVGTDFDFITASDPSAFERLEYAGFKQFEMPDKRGSGEPLVQDAFLFDAHFKDGTTIRLAMDRGFGSAGAAAQDAKRYMGPLGRLPSLYRRNIKHIVVHQGGDDTTAFAEDQGHFFVIYSGNATKRIATHDLEETFFHEATHASIQADHLTGSAWQNAKRRDGAYISSYAKSEDQEDFAESALFAYTLIHHPERIPPADRERIEKQIGNRIAFFRTIYTR